MDSRLKGCIKLKEEAMGRKMSPSEISVLEAKYYRIKMMQLKIKKI